LSYGNILSTHYTLLVYGIIFIILHSNFSTSFYFGSTLLNLLYSFVDSFPLHGLTLASVVVAVVDGGGGGGGGCGGGGGWLGGGVGGGNNSNINSRSNSTVFIM
jgi:hypothetical protein